MSYDDLKMNGTPSAAQISLQLAGDVDLQLPRFDDARPGDQEQRPVEPDVEAAELHRGAIGPAHALRLHCADGIMRTPMRRELGAGVDAPLRRLLLLERRADEADEQRMARGVDST